MSVKDKKRGRPSRKASTLSEARIIDTAKSLLLADGKIPSIRKLATALDVDAMAIYHYFSSKNALLVAITSSLVDSIYQPGSTSPITIDNWQQELHTLSASYLSLLTRYPGLLHTFLSMDASSPAAIFTDRYGLTIAPLALSAEQTKYGLDLLADYLHGFAFAMECAATVPSNSSTPTQLIPMPDMITGPLQLYCAGLLHIAADNQQP